MVKPFGKLVGTAPIGVARRVGQPCRSEGGTSNHTAEANPALCRCGDPLGALACVATRMCGAEKAADRGLAELVGSITEHLSFGHASERDSRWSGGPRRR